MVTTILDSLVMTPPNNEYSPRMMIPQWGNARAEINKYDGIHGHVTDYSRIRILWVFGDNIMPASRGSTFGGSHARELRQPAR